MRRTIFFLSLGLLVLGCKNETKKTKTDETPKTTESSAIKSAEFGRTNYAVVWNWTTTDEKLVSGNTAQISNELTDLWKKGVIENVYYDSAAKADKLGHFPNISFFLRAQSEQEAETILDDLSIVKKGISKYKVHPVGTKWLGRNEEAIEKNGITKSWVAVWATSVDHNSKLSKNEVKENAKEQSDAVISLWDQGLVENVYFDIMGIEQKNDITDFILFINAATETEARDILNSLPFYKKNIAKYQLFSVGVFWMGSYEEN